jgi:hypothetical protein
MEVATEAVHSDRKMQMLGLLAMDGAEGIAEQQQQAANSGIDVSRRGGAFEEGTAAVDERVLRLLWRQVQPGATRMEAPIRKQKGQQNGCLVRGWVGLRSP